MDDLDRKLLTFISGKLPLEARPFRSLQTRLGIDSAEILLRISRLKESGLIDGLYAHLNLEIFDYRKVWVAFRLGGNQALKAQEIVRGYPGWRKSFTCLYPYNFWAEFVFPSGHTIDRKSVV